MVRWSLIYPVICCREVCCGGLRRVGQLCRSVSTGFAEPRWVDCSAGPAGGVGRQPLLGDEFVGGPRRPPAGWDHPELRCADAMGPSQAPVMGPPPGDSTSAGTADRLHRRVPVSGIGKAAMCSGGSVCSRSEKCSDSGWPTRACAQSSGYRKSTARPCVAGNFG